MILLDYLECPALHIIDAVRILEKGLSLLQRVPNHKINTQKYTFLNLHI